jgi:hypothetical protein
MSQSMSAKAMQSRHATGPLGPKFEIAYSFDGKANAYLPDFVGITEACRPIIVECGRTRKAAAMRLADEHALILTDDAEFGPPIEDVVLWQHQAIASVDQYSSKQTKEQQQ